ncbi:MAG: heme-binding protein [Hyphomonadaceae bacterium]
MSRISLKQANVIIEAALAKGVEAKMKPLSVAVVDAGGHLIAFQRQDGASIARFQIAAGKATGALALGVSSRKVAEIAVERPTFFAGLAAAAPAGVIAAAGGVIIVENGAPIGAVGVTGDTSDNDELAAFAGIAAAGLTAQ